MIDIVYHVSPVRGPANRVHGVALPMIAPGQFMIRIARIPRGVDRHGGHRALAQPDARVEVVEVPNPAIARIVVELNVVAIGVDVAVAGIVGQASPPFE